MELDRTALQKNVNAMYQREHEALGESVTHQMLDDARRWDVSGILDSGGVVTFAHVGVADCGIHVAAAVNACLDTGADTVLAISVLHAFSEEMELARRDVAAGGQPSDHATWGIQGPGIAFRSEWQGDHAMRSLRYFWQVETRRRGINDRRLVERYPFLAGGHPEELPNIHEVVGLAENAVIVATGDQVHHGIGYGMTPEDSLDIDPEGRAAARESMEVGIDLIERGDYWGYNEHSVTAMSDDRDVAQLYRFLRGPLRGELLDIGLSDSADLYNQPRPTWAAGGFISFASVGEDPSSPT
ncbi:MAG: hypothetical protein M3132_14955 [Actinomycetia bacterium]|nr:hypothetical protein [Actinomycetes bacterium]